MLQYSQLNFELYFTAQHLASKQISLVGSCILSMVNLEILITVRFFIDMNSHECLENVELCWQCANFGEMF